VSDEETEEAESSIFDYIKADEFKSEIVNKYYNLLNKLVLSNNELIIYNGNRSNYEKSIVLNIIRNYIYVDPSDLSKYYVILPTNSKNPIILEITKEISKSIFDEVYPIALQGIGLSTQKFAELIYNSAISKYSYELLTSKIGNSANFTKAINTLRLSNFSKFVGSSLTKAGIYIEAIGTAMMWIEFLTNNMAPEIITDEDIAKSSTRQFLLLFKNMNN
jgi:hypothetical protein